MRIKKTKKISKKNEFSRETVLENVVRKSHAKFHSHNFKIEKKKNVRRSRRFYFWSDFGFFPNHVKKTKYFEMRFLAMYCPGESINNSGKGLHIKSTLNNAILANGFCWMYTKNPVTKISVALRRTRILRATENARYLSTINLKSININL